MFDMYVNTENGKIYLMLDMIVHEPDGKQFVVYVLLSDYMSFFPTILTRSAESWVDKFKWLNPELHV